MKKLYLITGATGHVGTILTSELLKRHAHIRALVLPGRGKDLPEGIETTEGNITEAHSLIPFFDRTGYDFVTLIHCAALITVASGLNPQVWNINVNGTKNIMEQAAAAGVERVVYVSSVHAIPEKTEPEILREVSSFSPDSVHGQYAKKGLNVSIVHPSGIIGPGDTQRRNHMIRTLHAMAEGIIPVALHGGYDFVDSRDVAAGILACEEKGRAGECYILNGHYITVSEMLNIARGIRGKKPRKTIVPHYLAKLFAPAGERLSLLLRKKPPLFTPYSVYTLHTNGHFSHAKATAEFGYAPRPIEESIRDSFL